MTIHEPHAAGATARAAGRDRDPEPARRCRLEFLRHYPGAFRDPVYLAGERGPAWAAHERWEAALAPAEFRSLLRRGRSGEIAARAVRIVTGVRGLSRFERMALRNAVKTRTGARVLAAGLEDFLYRAGEESRQFTRWCAAIERLPRTQARVFTWPIVTVFGFFARPKSHLFVKPTVLRAAARAYGFELHYRPVPSWDGYARLRALARLVRRDLEDLRPRDQIDLQAFLWVQGAEEYRR